MKELKYKTFKNFSNPEDICLFVNRSNYQVVSIIYKDYQYTVFYYE